MKQALTALMTLASIPAFAGTFKVSPKIGHQNIGFSARNIKTAVDISTSAPGEAEVTENRTVREPVNTGYNNTTVAGIRGIYALDALSFVTDIDNARYHFSQGFTDVYGVSLLSEVPFYSTGSLQTYALGGLSLKWIMTNQDIDESTPNFSLNSDIEPLEALNLEAGLGSSYKIAGNFSVNLEYKYSDTIASDGSYIRMKTTGRTENRGLIRTSARSEFEKFRATIQELSLIANWTL